jgi:hypothetical protein
VRSVIDFSSSHQNGLVGLRGGESLFYFVCAVIMAGVSRVDLRQEKQVRASITAVKLLFFFFIVACS